MKRVKIIRFCAYGDAVHMSHLPRLLKDVGFDYVEVETNFKGYQILSYNPFIDNLVGINPEVIFKNFPYMLEKHFECEAEKFDYFINLTHSIERRHLAMEDESIYYMSNEARLARYGDINFVDLSTISAGFPELVGKYKPEVYFTDEEHAMTEERMSKYKDKFVVLMNLSGTGPHKRLVDGREIAERILNKYPNAHIITTGGPGCTKYDFSEDFDRAETLIKKVPFRQAVLISKYCDCVIGCESGLMCGATMWEVPVVQLMTAASVNSHCKYNPNDYSLQSPCYCSPCFKGPYDYLGCPHKDGSPLCVYFDVEKILEKVGQVYDNSSRYAVV